MIFAAIMFAQMTLFCTASIEQMQVQIQLATHEAVRIADMGKTKSGKIYVLTAPDGSWHIVGTVNGQSCLLVSGQDWELIEERA